MCFLCFGVYRGALQRVGQAFLMAGVASSLTLSDYQLLPHTPAVHLIIIASLNTLACCPLAARLFSTQQHVVVYLRALAPQATMPPSLLHLCHQPLLHLGPSVPHSTSISSQSTTDVLVSPATMPADSQPTVYTCVSPTCVPPVSIPLSQLSHWRLCYEPHDSTCYHSRTSNF